MAGDGRNTEDVTIPMLFLFNKEGNIILDAMHEYQEVEVLLSDKAKDRNLDMDDSEQKSEEDVESTGPDLSISECQKEVASHDERSCNVKPSEYVFSSQSIVPDTETQASPRTSSGTDQNLIASPDGSPESGDVQNEDTRRTDCHETSGENQGFCGQTSDQAKEGTEVEPEQESNPNISQETEARTIDSLMSDWKEEIDAFEMMDKDEL
uniref:ER degradation enhancer, mannosidase alpha-like 3 n=1 Tax=Callorhinchus milii TaxID=7868 RepID=V9L2N2_CALMI